MMSAWTKRSEYRGGFKSLCLTRARPTSRRETDDTQGCVGTKRNLPKTQEHKNAESAQAQSGTGSGRVGALASV